MGVSSEVGILDLSMPDKNAITEVCYVCGDEYRRGSLSELCTREPKDEADVEPTFPIFNEAHPRPARSRPKDPRCMVQACKACVQHLMQQWQHHQIAGMSVFQRPYTLRKRPISVTERSAMFVCYTCGTESVSSLLRLVYCGPNAENEPYYPFIVQLKAYAAASPISLQGMVQVCALCHEKHAHAAEGGTAAAESVAAAAAGRSAGPSADGRFTPSDNKSQANGSESSHVRYRPYESLSQTSSTMLRDHHTRANSMRRDSSRPSTPVLHGQLDNAQGQYP